MDNFYATMSLRQVENNEMLLNTISKQTEWFTNNVRRKQNWTESLSIKTEHVYIDVTAKSDSEDNPRSLLTIWAHRH